MKQIYNPDTTIHKNISTTSLDFLIVRKILLPGLMMLLMLTVPNVALAQIPVTSGLKLHLDASQLGLNNEDPVATWTDVSGNDYHAIQNTTLNQPSFILDGLNGMPVVRFDGENNYLQSVASNIIISDNSNFTIIAVASLSSNTAGTFVSRRIVSILEGSSNSNVAYGVSSAGKVAGFSRNGTTASQWEGEAIATNTWYSFGLQVTNRIHQLYLNGVNSGDGVSYTPTNSPSSHPLIIGRDHFTGNRLWHGDIAEIIIYDRNLNYEERSLIESYLSDKYGFSKSEAPVTAGLVLHLDAATIENLNTEEPVAKWSDLSGNGHHAVQGNSANQPIFISEGLNGNPVVRFDGVNDFLTSGPSNEIIPDNANFTIFAIASLKSTRTESFVSRRIVSILEGATNSNIAYGVSTEGNIAGFTRNETTATQWQGSEIILDKHYSYGLQVKNNEHQLFLNGLATGSQVKYTPTNYPSIDPVIIGRDHLSGTRIWDGDIAEILIYDRDLSYNERMQVELYLDEKYGLTSEWKEWTGATDYNWDEGSNWEPAGVPENSNNVLIPGGLERYPELNSTTEVKAILINTGAELTIGENGHLTIGSSLILDGGLVNNGNITIPLSAFLTVKPGASLNSSNGILNNSAGQEGLIIESDLAQTGSIIVFDPGVEATVQRFASGNQWHIISPPVKGQEIQDFISNSNISYSNSNNYYAMTHYEELRNVEANTGGWGDYYTSSTSGTMTPGQGYLAGRTGNGHFLFSGELENGNVSFNITRDAHGWNAIGNPYATAIGVTTEAESIANFLGAYGNQLDPEYQALFIYDPTGNGGYKTINEVFTGIGSIDQNYIQPGQGFIVKSRMGGGTVQFTPLMQYHDHESSFYKKSTREPWPFVQLEVSHKGRLASTLVAFNSNMTLGLDPGYDAGQYGADEKFRLYTRLVEGDNDVNFTIQALPDQEFKDLAIPVGFDFAEGGEVTFSADLLRLPPNVSAILEDRELDIFTSLMNENIYKVFLEENTTGPGRFFLHADIQITSSDNLIDEKIVDGPKVHIYSHGKEVFIAGEVNENTYATVYDLLGRRIMDVKLFPSDMNSFRVDELKSGIYVVRLSGMEYSLAVSVFIE